MDLRTYLQVGERLDLELDTTSYKSIVHEIGNDNTVWLSPPTRKGVPVILRAQQVVNIIFYRPDGLYAFEAELMGRAVQEQLTFLVFQARGEPRKHQRRDCYRLQTSLEVSVALLEADKESNAPMEFTTYTVDVSDGGMCIKSDYRISTGAMLDCELTLGMYETIYVRCLVVRASWVPGSIEYYLLGLQFLDITDKMRRRLSKYILKEQVKFRDSFVR